MSASVAPVDTPTFALAHFASSLRREHLDDTQAAFVRKSLLDWLGCCVAGADEQPVLALDAVYASTAGSGPATLLRRGRRASVLDAALLNAASGCIHDLDDVHPGSIAHPAAVLAPTVLALGEWLGASGRELTTAYAAGFEVLVRVGLATEPELYQRGWHATGVLGTFGACAAAGWLLRLEPGRMATALGVAATQASGLRELMGTGARCLHQGRAASAGILAASWAAQGIDACRDGIGGRYGLRVLSGTLRHEAILDGLGDRMHLGETCYKRHAASGALHAAIDATLMLRDSEGLRPGSVDRIDVLLHPLALDLCANHAAPTNVFSAKQSLHFTVALALSTGRCDLDQFTPALIHDPDLRALRARVSMQADPTMQYVEAMPAEVTVTTADGRRLSRRVDVPRGRSSHPLGWDELAAKFHALASPALGEAERLAIVDTVARLDDTSAPALTALLAA